MVRCAGWRGCRVWPARVSPCPVRSSSPIHRRCVGAIWPASVGLVKRDPSRIARKRPPGPLTPAGPPGQATTEGSPALPRECGRREGAGLSARWPGGTCVGGLGVRAPAHARARARERCAPRSATLWQGTATTVRAIALSGRTSPPADRLARTAWRGEERQVPIMRSAPARGHGPDRCGGRGTVGRAGSGGAGSGPRGRSAGGSVRPAFGLRPARMSARQAAPGPLGGSSGPGAAEDRPDGAMARECREDRRG